LQRQFLPGAFRRSWQAVQQRQSPGQVRDGLLVGGEPCGPGPGLVQITHGLLHDARFLKVACQLNGDIPGTIAVQPLQSGANSFMQVPPFHVVQGAVEVFLEENVAESVPGDGLPIYAADTLSLHQTMSAV
jgi:hypothetical protein